MEDKTALARPQSLELAEPEFTQALPLTLVSLLERRYLLDLQPGAWDITAPEDHSRPLLRQVIGLGRPRQAGEWARAMPHILSACHDPGHSVVMAVHGTGRNHHLYVGARRMVGAGARSTEDYLMGQESAFKAHLSGLSLAGTARLDGSEMAGLSAFLQTAPALAAITGIPSRRGGDSALDFQTLDCLIRAIGNQRYALIVVAEPLESSVVDQTLDGCRRLKSEIHAYIRRTVSRTRGGSESEAVTAPEETKSWTKNLPYALYALATFSSLAFGNVIGGGFQAAGLGLMYKAGRDAKTRQISSGENWSEQGGIELLDANAEACESLLQTHIDRLQSARSEGWWRTAVYIAAENDAALNSVSGAVRSLCAGRSTSLDPIRSVCPPSHLLRDAIARCQVLEMRPSGGNAGHPLGESFNALATCINSEELSVLVNMPQHEIPGLPMRDQSDFALSAPPPTDDSIELGTLRDGLGRDVCEVSITAGSLNRHVFVTGINGSGKTNTCMRILLEAYDKLGVPFLVIEPAKAEYRGLAAARRLAGRLRVYAIGGPSPLPFRLNPLSPVAGIPLGRHIDLLKAVFNASFPMFAGMSYVLEDALLEVYAERGWSLYTSSNSFLGQNATLDQRSALTPNLEDLHDKVEAVLERKNYGQEIHRNLGAALRSRLRSLMIGNKGVALNTRRSTPLEDLFESPTVIELENLGDDEEKAFVMALVFGLLYEYAEVRKRGLPPDERGKLQHLTLIEEAHRLLTATRGQASAEVGDPRGKAVSMFTDMLAEMRAYGEGFIIADQIPTKLAPETLKNTNLKIVHRLVAPDDRELAGSCMNLNDSQKRHLNNLPPGVAIVHDERIGEAVETAVAVAKDAAGVVDVELALEPTAVAAGERLYLYRHAGCRSCPSPCEFYHQLSAPGSRPQSDRKLVSALEALFMDDCPRAWDAWQGWLAGRRLASRARSGAGSGLEYGIRYCAAAQGAYEWLGGVLAGRNEILPGAGQLSPDDRLSREAAARALGELFSQWLSRAELDEGARAAFGAARTSVVSAIADAPPREAGGCTQCPARCLALPFVGPHLAAISKQIAPMIVGTQNPRACLVSIERTIAPIEDGIEALMHDHRGSSQGRWLYCVLTNAELPSAAEDKRAELLASLLQSDALSQAR